MKGLDAHPRLEIIYWMHLARRDLLVQAPKYDAETYGTFALRSPIRPNPIATAIVDVIAIEDGTILVRGLDCVDGTPLLDLKPERRMFAGDRLPNPPSRGEDRILHLRISVKYVTLYLPGYRGKQHAV